MSNDNSFSRLVFTLPDHYEQRAEQVARRVTDGNGDFVYSTQHGVQAWEVLVLAMRLGLDVLEKRGALLAECRTIFDVPELLDLKGPNPPEEPALPNAVKPGIP